jgi:hypothetical protein
MSFQPSEDDVLCAKIVYAEMNSDVRTAAFIADDSEKGFHTVYCSSGLNYGIGVFAQSIALTGVIFALVAKPVYEV